MGHGRPELAVGLRSPPFSRYSNFDLPLDDVSMPFRSCPRRGKWAQSSTKTDQAGGAVEAQSRPKVDISIEPWTRSWRRVTALSLATAAGTC